MHRQVMAWTLLVLMGGCAAPSGPQEERRAESAPIPLIPMLRAAVQDDLSRYVGEQQAAALKAVGGSSRTSVPGRHPVLLQSLTDPWKGLTRLEAQSLRLVTETRSGPADLSRVLSLLEGVMDRAPEAVIPVPLPSERTPAVHAGYLLALLEQATAFREQALRHLSQQDRRFLVWHAASLVEQFSAQVSEPDRAALVQAQADARFLDLAAGRLDYTALLSGAQVLTSLADPSVLQNLEHSFGTLKQPVRPPLGVSGEVWLVRETAVGLIVVGGPGSNVYQLDHRFGLVLDLGGDDQYLGEIAAPGGADRGISVVVDLAGNDSYHPTTLGLATGRLGVGLLVDRAGNDTYELADGAGGTGFAGIGILYDLAGNDRYLGSRFTQGAAVGGLGLVLDGGGNDVHTSFGYAIGFGGPLGAGAVIDLAGDDRYQCGGKYPSAYNALDVPEAQPGDPRFQYDAFGIGVGAGKRIYKNSAPRSYSLAGGWGLVLDLAGHDWYESSNFSQGVGYFFGIGTKLDLAGNDEHQAARYGHGAAAHSGVGLHLDYHGDDRYDSAGPFYNGAAAWELSVALSGDAGQGNDLYDLRRSDGLGRADHQAWSVFLDDGGRDQYLVPSGHGRVTDGGMSGFFDLAGEDEYSMAGRGNRQTILDGAGGLFVDR